MDREIFQMFLVYSGVVALKWGNIFPQLTILIVGQFFSENTFAVGNLLF